MTTESPYIALLEGVEMRCRKCSGTSFAAAHHNGRCIVECKSCHYRESGDDVFKVHYLICVGPEPEEEGDG